ncbi:MAG: spore germination protein [Clostridia bacterium]|nr:spore germination protein [Clostridia bacterium]
METLGTDFGDNLDRFREIFRADGTFRHRVFRSGMGVRCAVLYLDGMISATVVNEDVIRPLMQANPITEGQDSAAYASEEVLWAGEVKGSNEERTLVSAMLHGGVVLLFEGSVCALYADAKGFRSRGVQEPQNESVLQGPREGFGEVAIQNLAMLRRKLQTEDLCMEPMTVGRRSGTAIYLCYLRSLASPRLVKEVRRRLGTIDIDGVLDTNYLNELIRDRGRSVFKTVGTTERPDVAAAKLLEGRVAIMADGTPVALTMPYLFAENFQSDEDYYLNFWVSSIGRFLRYVCFFLTVSVPAVYLALLTHHQSLLPTFLLLSSAGTRGGVPFSSLAECLLLILVLEILKETGARMPQNLGHTLGIIGGLVVGEAAVEARLISASMLIVVAVSGIAGLMIPRLRAAVFYVRLGLVLLAAWMGIVGCLVGITLLLIRMMGISSFGVPYLLPLETPTVQGLKDTVVRLPWSMMRTRPFFTRDRVRQKRGNDR